jgi:mannosyl-3-phosphoglycerate phosphatase
MASRKRTAVRLRPKSPEPLSGSCAVFTSVDGTLLDAETFDLVESRAAVQRLHDASIPVIPVTVMTLGEIEPIAADLGMRRAMIIEAGGAVARWKNGGWELEPCGPPAEMLLDVIGRIEQRSGANLLVYSALSEADAARFSGRSGAMLQASTRRFFSEPFVIESGDIEEVIEAAASIGFSVRRGRRFFHLCRECDEGEAFARVRDELRCDVAVGVGGSLLDADFLSRADVAVVVPRSDGQADPELLARVPHARLAPAPGPAGWAAAVEDVWQSLAAASGRARRA